LHSSDLEPQVKKTISRLYQVESNLTKRRNDLVDQLSALEDEIKQVIAKREEISTQFKKAQDEKASEADQAALHTLLGQANEHSGALASQAGDSISALTQNLANWADQAAEAGKATWNNIKGNIQIPSIGSINSGSDAKELYLKQANQAVNDLGHRISVLEDEISSATAEAKKELKKQQTALKTKQKNLKAEIDKLREAGSEAWDDIKGKIEKLVNDAK
ncbi:MAG: hypothetical protein AAF804_15185, partial [Bacteroidota bacterium]